ncbi:Mtn21-like protein, putative isoform 2 [Hibiscus syriacus]|uniref:Mtn21-like protein, putative isoform 2 n=1 Tax=Hibiscus syriacus TaxID=106335 RepID=A0A6A2ZMT0_HIBSY|nr:Mtn21-like protein, putative isoform 2 [Hibiscus syriacus]
MSVKFPYLYSSTALMCVTGGMQGALVALCTVRDWSQWRLGWNVRLLAVAYVVWNPRICFVGVLGFMGSSFDESFVCIYFQSLGVVFVAVLGSLLLDEKLYLGSIIGGLMIVCGVYVVLWGKAKEMKQKIQLVPVPTVDVDSHEQPEGDKPSADIAEDTLLKFIASFLVIYTRIKSDSFFSIKFIDGKCRATGGLLRACATGCPLTNPRLRQRWECKCEIQCSPDSIANGIWVSWKIKIYMIHSSSITLRM